MSSNLRVDRILPSTGTEVGVGTATGSVALYGDVNVAGTLTYEDVTNIDSVGVVTARSGLHVTGGSVGIGTDNPLRKLDILGTGRPVEIGSTNASNIVKLYNSATGRSTYNGVDIQSNSTAGGIINAYGGYLDFGTSSSNGTNATSRLRITSDGKVAIGFNAPAVAGLSISNSSTNRGFEFDTGSGFDSTSCIRAYDRPTTAYKSLGLTGSDIKFGINDVEKVRISSGGLAINKNAAADTDIEIVQSADPTLRLYDTRNAAYKADFMMAGSAPLIRNNNTSTSDRTLSIQKGTTDHLVIQGNGDVQARRARSNTTGDVALSIQPSDSSIHYGFRIDIANNNLNLDRVGSGNIATFRYDGLIFSKALHVTDNLTPTSGRGVEIFEASAGVGQIQSYNRDSNSWDELRLKGSEVRLYANNNLRLDVQNAQSYLYGTSDGVLNVSTTDSRGSFIRYQLNGSTKCWAGCSQGLGTNGNQDDFGIRATRDIRFRAGTQTNMRLTAAGYLQVASDGDISGDNENIFQQHQTTYNVLQLRAETSSYQASGGGALAVGVIRSASSSYTFAGWYSGNNSSNFQDRKFNFRGDGNAYADGSWSGGGADYAEYFEWSDGNTSSEDRRGISVVLDGDKIREATGGEDPIGVISANPSVVGDADDLQWKNKYLRTEYGSFDLDENGEQKLNPDYNPNQEYVSRENRPEWDCVGLMGKLRIRKGQVTGSRWIKMRDVSVNVEEWLVR